MIAMARTPEKTSARQGAGPVHVLYVEDDAGIRQLVTMVLEATGRYRVTSCASGAEAVDRAAEIAPDLLLLDVMMPGMDGVETAHALRGIEATRAAPVIFLTARSLPSDRVALAEAGAVRTITKPFLPDRLVAALDEIVGS